MNPLTPMTVEQAAKQGYMLAMEIPGRGMCALMQMNYTYGLCYGLNQVNYAGRYCYPNLATAVEALIHWSGEGDPDDPHWIKHKGHSEYSNPKNDEYDSSYAN